MQLSYFRSEDTDYDLVIDALRSAFRNTIRQDETLDDFLDRCRDNAIEEADVSPLFVLTDADLADKYDRWLRTKK